MESPRGMGRSEAYPTTFVQADTSSFKQVVQMLTGSSETVKQAASKPNMKPNKKQFKLYERRNSLGRNNNNLSINPLSSFFSARKPDILSPSILDFPSLVLSPVTPLIPDPFHRSEAEEDKAIKEKGFFLHPSPVSTPRDSQPRLLPLFPTTSPKASSSGPSSSAPPSPF
ncbi:hypothetical protein Fmac_009823 [Flemingia macrophylla]|uniref:VQ domain-containing protein n=1 Tax=Flemingia macrophylla TaxID=520843 RepID=A0ABD1N2L0_9FABA